MPASPACPAVAAAKERSGVSYAELGRQLGKSEDQVVNLLTSNHADHEAVAAVAKALHINTPLPSDPVHGA